MKNLTRLLALGALLTAGAAALPVFAQNTQAGGAAAAGQDDAAAKTALYEKFTAAFRRGSDLRKKDPNFATAGNREAYQQAMSEAAGHAREYL